MRRRARGFALVGVCVLLIGCNRDESRATRSETAAADRYDLEFLDSMIRHHEKTIAFASTARGKTVHPELTSFAEQIVSAHETELRQLRAWRETWYAGVATTVSTKLPGALALPRDIAPPAGEPSHEGDIEIIRQLRQLQQSAAAMAEEAAIKATHPEVRTFAATHLPIHRREAASLDEWERLWMAHDENARSSR